MKYGLGVVVGRVHDAETAVAGQVFERFGTKHIDRVTGLQSLLSEFHGRLRRGHYMALICGNPQFGEYFCHYFRAPRSIIGDVHDGYGSGGEVFLGVRQEAAAFPYCAVQVEK